MPSAYRKMSVKRPPTNWKTTDLLADRSDGGATLLSLGLPTPARKVRRGRAHPVSRSCASSLGFRRWLHLADAGGAFAQLAPHDLAGRCHRQAVDELDRAGDIDRPPEADRHRHTHRTMGDTLTMPSTLDRDQSAARLRPTYRRLPRRSTPDQAYVHDSFVGREY
jgi:hypothetical protein